MRNLTMKKTMVTAAVLTTFLAQAFAQSPSVVPAPPGTPALSSKVWIGRYAEYEEFLKTAPIERLANIPVGVTHPRRAHFAPGGLAESAAVKDLPPGIRTGFWESYKSEIAAYELDRLLGLDMVPPTVERRIGNDLVSVQLWVQRCRAMREVDQNAPHDVAAWNRQVHRQRVFDNLIANIDENASNILVDPLWNIILIDHSRCFFRDALPFERQTDRIDRPFFERLKALDEASAMARLRPWVLSEGTVRQILKRRDKIVARLEARARDLGEDEVFVP
jgi:hypothetical protein